MKSCYIVTGAGGHLGSTILKQLLGRDLVLRALVYPEFPKDPLSGVTYYVGDLREPDTLLPLFADSEGLELRVIHAAGLVSLSQDPSALLHQVNVEGTENLLSLSRAQGVRRFLYVSSVHALDPGTPGIVISEPKDFSPDRVEGAYAKSKAIASQLVLDANRPDFETLLALPSGMLGPGDPGNNHLVRMLQAYLQGTLRFCVKGGYNFVDVRDVAQGCIAAMQRGKPGHSYLLTGRHYEIRELLNMVRSVRNRPRPLMVPLWLARTVAPAAARHAAKHGQTPLFTPYSLYTLTCNDRFSHSKAAEQLGYLSRDLRYTVRDTILELLEKPE